AEITETHGKEDGKRLREAAKLERDQQQRAQATSAARRRALRETTQAEERSRSDQARRWETAQREYMRHLQARERADRIAKREEDRKSVVKGKREIGCGCDSSTTKKKGNQTT